MTLVRESCTHASRVASAVPLAANSSLFPSLAEQTLGEIKALLCFRQLLLEVLDTTFNGLEALGGVGRQRLRTSGTQTSELEDRESGNPHEYQERGKKDRWFHEASR